MPEQRDVTNPSSLTVGLAAPLQVVVPPYEPITLTWVPPPDENTSSSNRSIEPNQGRLAEARPATPIEAPPSYNVARVPNYSVTYTFSSLGPASGAMILIPPADSPDTRPLYHISVSHDSFLPHCLITSVLRGGTAQGAYVGGFTSILGIEAVKKQAQTVCIRDCEHPYYTIFEEKTVKNKGMACRTYVWYSFNSKRALKWTTSTKWPLPFPSTCIIVSDPKQDKVAEFTPYDQLKRRGDPFLENTLLVKPAGHAHLDDILMSALLLERQRKMEVSTNTPYLVR